jgi:hypothetical protein
LGMSLKQLIILMIGWAIAYMIFKGLAPIVEWKIAAIPSIFVFLITLMVVLFKHSEMTFIPFMLNLIRTNLNNDPKIWVKWVDSFEPIEIWYVTQIVEKKKANVDTSEKIEQIEALKDKLNKI